MLHILNGDALVQGFKESNIEGDYLVWRECLFEGPVSNEVSVEKLIEIRAKYIADTYSHDEEGYISNMEEFFRRICKIQPYEEVNLWFDYDLFCQVNLMYILNIIAETDKEVQVCLVFPGKYEENSRYKGFGGAKGEDLREFFSNRTKLSGVELKNAVKVWKAYSSAEPPEFEGLLNKSGGTYPLFKEALEAHLERFPSVKNGLNRIEQIILNAVRTGINEKFQILNRVWVEGAIYGLGDSQIFNYIEQLTKDGLLMCNERIEITRLGQEILSCTQNYLDIRRTTTWIGGSYLADNTFNWLWDREGRTLRQRK